MERNKNYIVTPPFDTKTIDSINNYQEKPIFHVLTCKNAHPGNSCLIATRSGLKCPTCGYIQDYAFKFMADRPFLEKFRTAQLRDYRPDIPKLN